MTNHCAKVLNRILKDPEHLVTKKLHRTTARPGHPSIYKLNKARTNGYRDNVLQSYLRTIQNGCTDLYIAVNKSTIMSRNQLEKTTMCQECGRSFQNQRGLNIHKRYFKDKATCKKSKENKAKISSTNQATT